MEILEFNGINSFLVGISRFLLENAVPRTVRGNNTYEINHPVIFKITEPRSRLITIKERGWNHTLPYAESLWIASGRNDMTMIGKYLKKLYQFSDDLKSMRAAYGPRLRYFNGSPHDYNKDSTRSNSVTIASNVIEIDQYAFIEKSFKKDPFTRQAVITITDPAKDYFTEDSKLLKSTKDFPCTNNLHFIRKGDTLDLYVNMRSNDFFWGATGVNIFNFTFIQEYFAQILGLKLGNYYHIVNNLHYYEEFSSKIQVLANISEYTDEYHEYAYSFRDLTSFDLLISKLEYFEKQLTDGSTSLMEFGDEFFNDWAKVLYSFHQPSQTINFNNPILNQINESKKKKQTSL